MSEEYILEDIKKWKEELESRIEELYNILNSKSKQMEILSTRMKIIEVSSRKFSNPEKYWLKYGQPLKDEYNLLNEDLADSKDLKEQNELKALLQNVNQYISEVAK
ncbi:hypothetical protein C7Y47_24040 [Lysinibacillus sphaericus]|uniref:DUF5082 domain-containing protein n=1 Tax=Lysinibacillus sphaericus TaxID=1421 RepID=A0A544U7D8_LYSSH|nr:hypothetical protein [Lysinibacillus sp. SDF0037]TQR26860.1 hypothetical protein C7Y47_24040 [Lysinibacillus sp. SDF0037]